MKGSTLAGMIAACILIYFGYAEVLLTEHCHDVGGTVTHYVPFSCAGPQGQNIVVRTWSK